MLLLAFCSSMYKQAPNQTNFLAVYVYKVVLFLASCTLMSNKYQNKPITICLCSRDGAFKQAPQQTYL